MLAKKEYETADSMWYTLPRSPMRLSKVMLAVRAV